MIKVAPTGDAATPVLKVVGAVPTSGSVTFTFNSNHLGIVYYSFMASLSDGSNNKTLNADTFTFT